MSALIQFFNIVLYQPLLNLLILLYEYIPGHDFGVAVIVLTIITRFALHPSSFHAIKSQKALNALQPKIKELQEKYKKDKEGLAKATMELYRREKISPFSGCLPMLLQLPILIALYQVFLKGLDPQALSVSLYHFVRQPGLINPMFLGILNLSQPNLILAILTGALQFFQSKISMNMPKTGKTKDFSSMMQSQMLYFLPAFTVFIVWKLGAIIGLYWMVSTAFSIGEYYLAGLKTKNKGVK